MENLPGTLEEMRITTLPEKVSGLPGWITRNMNLVLKELLMHSQLTLVLQTVYKWDLEINKMLVEPVETVVKQLGVPYVQSNLNFLADFQVVTVCLVRMNYQ